MKRIAKLRKQIEESNELFQAMSNDEKKVQIAKDCIERIKIKQFQPYSGAVISGGSIRKLNKGFKIETSLKEVLNNDNVIPCDVCAKGGLFMSYIGRTNELKLCELSFNKSELLDEFTDPNSPTTIEHTKLLEIFDIRELSYIECAFEGTQYLEEDLKGKAIAFSSVEYLKAHDFYCLHINENDRLITICNNIIQNKGRFTL